MDGAQVKRTRTRLGATVSTRHASSTVWYAALLVLIVGLSLIVGRQEQAQVEDTWLRDGQHNIIIVLENTSFGKHHVNMAGAGLKSHVVKHRHCAPRLQEVLRVVSTTPQAVHNVQTKRERKRNEYSR